MNMVGVHPMKSILGAPGALAEVVSSSGAEYKLVFVAWDIVVVDAVRFVVSHAFVR
jgi:hypothetical protein